MADPVLTLLQQHVLRMHATARSIRTASTAVFNMIATDDDREMSEEPIQRVDVNEWTDEQFVQRTRFTRRDIQRIINAMQLPASFSSDNTSDVNTFFAMTLLLRRLSYPIRLKDLQHEFGYHFTTIRTSSHHSSNCWSIATMILSNYGLASLHSRFSITPMSSLHMNL